MKRTKNESEISARRMGILKWDCFAGKIKVALAAGPWQVGFGRLLALWMPGVLIAFLAACSPPHQGERLRDCIPSAEVDSLYRERQSLYGLTEYQVLGLAGKPSKVSMSTRSEKEYRYPVCGQLRVLCVRFSGNGQAKEVFFR